MLISPASLRACVVKPMLCLCLLLQLFVSQESAAADPDEIRVALFHDYQPISGINLAGEPSGLIPDIWRLWSEKTGVRVNFIYDSFADSVQAVRTGRADVHGSLFQNQARSEWLDFSQTLLEVTSGLYYWRPFGGAPSIENLKGRSVGVMTGTHQEKFLREGGFGFRVRAFSDVTNMLRALARGEVAAIFHEDLAMDTLIRRAGSSGDIARTSIELSRNGLHVGIPKNRPDLRDLVDWGFSRITFAEYQAIESRWVDDEAARYYRARGTEVPFTALEKAWLEKTTTVRIGMTSNWPPISSADESGQADGMSPAILKLVNKRLGGILHIVPGPWSEIYKDVQEGRLDAIMDINHTRARQRDFNFTRPYLVIPHVLAGRKDGPAFRELNDLSGKTLALEKGFVTVSHVQDQYPEISVKEYGSTLDALSAVAQGEADAYVGNQAVVKHLIDNHQAVLSGLAIMGELRERNSVLSFGTRKDWPLLRDILDKALMSIPTSESARITNPWLGSGIKRRVALTPAEQSWLARHLDTEIRVLAEDWPPFNYMHNGQSTGMAIDYLRYAFTELGLQPKFVSLPWSEALQGIADAQKLDVIPALSPPPERAQFLAFTKPYLSFPTVIFTRDDADIMSDLDDLGGKTVAVERGFITDTRLSREHPNINLVRFDTTEQAIKAVSLGQADAYIGNLASGTFHIQTNGLSNLKVAAPTNYNNGDNAVGVRRDWPELASMLNKVLAQMTSEQHTKIRSAALAVRYEMGIDVKKILFYALPVVGVIVVIVIVIVVANRKLSREVEERKKVEERLTEREQWFRSLLESAPDATIIVNPGGEIVRVNRQAEILFGADRDKLLGQPIEMLVPDSHRSKHIAYRHGFVAASAPRSMGASSKLLARRMDGQEIPVEISLSPIETADGTLIAASVRDVTERRKAEAELAEKDLQLNSALENMSGGMFMVDKDLIIRVFNKKFVDLYKLPEVKVGMPLRDLLLLRAVRGEYGEGDPEELVEQRISGYRDRSISRIEDLVEDGTIIEGFRQPTADGGIVGVFNDITERKKAEQALANERHKLADLSGKLSRYLSPQIYEAIFSGVSDAQVRTERKKLTVFFSDIKNFTATTEEMEPEDMTYLLNDYLTKMSEIALEYGGTIDKYIGDAIMVFFGDPETKGVKQDALAAVKMAIAMQRRMVDLRAKWTDMGYRLPFHIRCGVNTGYCNVGNFGSEQRIDYTIIGGQVNLAARLESICEPDGVVISYETYSHVRDEIEAVPMEPIQVKGIKDPVEPFALQGIFDETSADERYIRRDDILGMRLWVDLMRLDEERRVASIKELEEAIEILKKKQTEAADD
ncbi:transporter substrate-binding domain-containing protein [bacterium SCSIO 12827]|nr:transporter substrate-binding domain-containing protein [bacterium SCSIO 12827]